MLKQLFTLLSVFILANASAQSDTLTFRSDLTILGRRQTGNLNQFGFNPSIRLSLGKSSFNAEVAATYQLLEVNGFRSINDFWTTGIVRLNPTQRLYPFAVTYYGFADSYKIERSLVGGAGAGLNVFSKSPRHYFQVHLFGGYSNVEFEEANSQSSPAFGTFLKSELPLFKNLLGLLWELHSYHSLEDDQFVGVNNLLNLRLALPKGFSLNVSHTTIFNNTVNEGIAKINTLMMFGLAHSLTKKF